MKNIKPTYTTIRVKVDARKRLQKIAAHMTVKDGEPRSADQAFDFAVAVAEKEMQAESKRVAA